MTRKQFWQDEFANNPRCNGIRVEYHDRARNIHPDLHGVFDRWDVKRKRVVRIRTCKGKRT